MGCRGRSTQPDFGRSVIPNLTYSHHNITDIPLPTLGILYLPTALINSASRVRYYNNKEIQIVKPNGVHRVHICGFQKEKEVRYELFMLTFFLLLLHISRTKNYVRSSSMNFLLVIVFSGTYLGKQKSK